MAGNTIGEAFRLTTFGESHGPVLGCIIDGCPPGLTLSTADIQPDMDRRRPGQSHVTTQRREADEVEIVSGVFEGKTTGVPIALLVKNTDQRSRDYEAIKDVLGRGMRITLISGNTASVIIAVAVVRRHERRRCGLQRVLSRENTYAKSRALSYRVIWNGWVRFTLRKLTGKRSIEIYFSAPTREKSTR